jgi:hypothetical protein
MVLRYGVCHFAISLQHLLIGVALAWVSLFISINEILVLFLELPTGE